MKEYIERNDALSCVMCVVERQRIKGIPAADVVEVVRCKDCIYYRNKQCESDDFWNAFHGDDIGVHFIPDPDFYCAFGERRAKHD